MRRTFPLRSIFLCLASVTAVSTMLCAQSPFDGTWRENLDQTKFSPKPIVFSVNNGMYDCSSCAPQIHVKADGQDQSVSGQAFDTVSVREVDSKSIEVKTKKDGKPEYEQGAFPAKKSSPAEMLEFLMEENGLKPADLPIPASRVSEILAGKRDISKAQAIALAERFKVSPAVFI